jgi:hypothetical protein
VKRSAVLASRNRRGASRSKEKLRLALRTRPRRDKFVTHCAATHRAYKL